MITANHHSLELDKMLKEKFDLVTILPQYVMHVTLGLQIRGVE